MGGNHISRRSPARGNRLVPRLLPHRPNRTVHRMAKLRSPPTAPEPPRVLIIEDELLIALFIEEMTREIGYRVSGVAYTVVLAHQELAKRNFDAVLCDINIGGRYNLEIADRLIELDIPFAFVTGYDYLVEPRHEKLPILQKPFTALELCTLLRLAYRTGVSNRRNCSAGLNRCEQRDCFPPNLSKHN